MQLGNQPELGVLVAGLPVEVHTIADYIEKCGCGAGLAFGSTSASIPVSDAPSCLSDVPALVGPKLCSYQNASFVRRRGAGPVLRIATSPRPRVTLERRGDSFCLHDCEHWARRAFPIRRGSGSLGWTRFTPVLARS